MATKYTITSGPTTYNPTVAKYGFATKAYDVTSKSYKPVTSQGSSVTYKSSPVTSIAQSMANQANRAGAKVLDTKTGQIRSYQPSDFVMTKTGVYGNIGLQPQYNPSTGGVKAEQSQYRSSESGYNPKTGLYDVKSMDLAAGTKWGDRLRPRNIVDNITSPDARMVNTPAVDVRSEQPYVAPFFGVQPIGTSKGGMKFFGSASYKQ